MGDGESSRKAVALGYERGKDRAPRVLAKGSGIVAERILELAKAHGIPLREDPALVSLLATVDVDSEIPTTLYQAVAEVLAFVYRLREARS
jgi:flagellar biosynthesis protein